MTTAKPSEGGCEPPADLSELTATDALLDRLGGRSATGDDRLDPTVAALLDLVAAVDEPRTEPDTGLAHLVEVLAGRPLYLAGAGLPADALDVDPIFDLQPGEVDPESTTSRVIDLTDHAPANSADPADPLDEADQADQADEDESADQVDEDESAEPSDPVRPVEIPAARTLTGSISTAPTLIPIQPGARRWERALSSVSLPAASVLLLLAVSGGVSAAVTGNPMTPVNGVSRVMAQLPGVDNPQRNLTQVKGEITAASNAVRENDAFSASRHLAAARRGLPDVPEDQKQQLSVMIENVQTLLAPLTPSPVIPTPPVGVEATSPSTLPTTLPSTQPSTTPTDASPSDEPSTGSQPTVAPTTPEGPAATTPPVDSTPVATASGS
jgi:hypothetical protein